MVGSPLCVFHGPIIVIPSFFAPHSNKLKLGFISSCVGCTTASPGEVISRSRSQPKVLQRTLVLNPNMDRYRRGPDMARLLTVVEVTLIFADQVL